MKLPFATGIGRDVVRISGPDAASYLQGQVSQDVAALAVGTSAWTFILQPQGKVDAWFRITRVAGDDYLADVDGGYGPALIARLQRFKLRVKVDLEALPWECVAVRGVAAAAIDHVALGAVIAPSVTWAGVPGVDLLGPRVTLPVGVPVGDRAAYDAWRVSVGMPAMGSELDESTIPAEAGVVDVSVSFTKGCYTGQELVARVDSRGNKTPRRLRLVRFRGAPDASHGGGLLPGTPLTAADGREVGVLTTVSASIAGAALAYVRREVEPPATAVVAGVTVDVEALPSR